MQALTEPKLPPTNKKSTVLIIKSNYEKNYYSKDKKHSVKNTCNLLHLICIQGPTMISQLSHRNLEIYTKDIFKVYCRKVWDEKLIK